MSESESMLTYRTEVREVSLVAGRWSWTWLFRQLNYIQHSILLFARTWEIGAD
ncbi:hypothetical protein [Oceanobacillus profundus]|uniref:hypothetical protein n=1 Tax=Oceanobacillus profundus TaxID=372463 RepID=UPI0026E2D66F|nr:hypothetical protein [Oceanobacillus profundus]